MNFPIKITYVIGTLDAGGAERQLLELLKALDRSRFEPSLVMFNRATAHRAQGLVESIFSLNLPSHSSSHWTIKAPIVARAMFRLAVQFRRTRPRIVHAILPAANILAAGAARFSSVPVLIGSRRSLVDAYRTSKVLSMVDQAATRCCTVMLGNSKAVVQELLELDGVDAAAVRRIANGVDAERFRPGDRSTRRQYGWTDDNIVFGMVANFIPYKRHIDFVRAAEMIIARNVNARFVMVGNDSRGILDSIASQINAKRLSNCFTIVPGTDKPEFLYPAMDVYVCASDTEGLSNVLLEAGASGLPLIATGVGGNSEIVLDGYNGFLVASHAPEAIAAAAIRFGQDQALRREMGMRSRDRILAKFSMRTMVTAYEDLYDELLHGHLSTVGAASVPSNLQV